jgi:hydroxymethylpyrimidine pyrophosphatase-like HAD family hydrolase
MTHVLHPTAAAAGRRKPKMIALDLDGTLLTSEKVPCAAAMDLLRSLDPATIRVIATGRNVASAGRFFPVSPSCPIDYVVAGSGGIVIHWPTQRIVVRNTLAVAREIAAALVVARIPFLLLKAPPENHEGYFFIPEDGTFCGIADDLKELRRRIAADDHSGSLRPYPADLFEPRSREGDEEAFGQFLLMGLTDVEATKTLIARAAPEGAIRFVTLTSDAGVTWLEALPYTVSKANGLAQIAALHGLSSEDCIAMGNDWNDLDMLEWAGIGCVMANTPHLFKLHVSERCPHVEVIELSNDERGVFRSLERVFMAVQAESVPGGKL